MAALGDGQADFCWQGRWLDEPEHESYGSWRGGVQVVFHGDRAQLQDWIEHHTVFVHVDKWGDPGRGARLAAVIRGEVLGDAQLGW